MYTHPHVPHIHTYHTYHTSHTHIHTQKCVMTPTLPGWTVWAKMAISSVVTVPPDRPVPKKGCALTSAPHEHSRRTVLYVAWHDT